MFRERLTARREALFAELVAVEQDVRAGKAGDGKSRKSGLVGELVGVAVLVVVGVLVAVAVRVAVAVLVSVAVGVAVGVLVGVTVLVAKPSRSSPRKVAVSIFCEMPPMSRRSSLKRMGPSPRRLTTSTLHLSPTRARISFTDWQSLGIAPLMRASL